VATDKRVKLAITVAMVTIVGMRSVKPFGLLYRIRPDDFKETGNL